jgi:hypothetical protein
MNPVSGFHYPTKEALVQFAAPMRVELDSVPTLAAAGYFVHLRLFEDKDEPNHTGMPARVAGCGARAGPTQFEALSG